MAFTSRATAWLAAAAVAGLVLSSGAAADTISLTQSGMIVGGENPAFEATVRTTFTFDPGCNGTAGSECGLKIKLEYLSSTGIEGQSQTLTGLLWQPLGSADFRDGPPGSGNFGGTVGAESLIGPGASIALGQLGTLGNLIDVSGHWGLNPAISVNSPQPYGTHYLSSVGSLFEGLVSPVPTLGMGQLFNGTVSSVEPNPPNGSRFGLVDPTTLNTTLGGMGFLGNMVAIQSSIEANILYLGQLSGIDTDLVLPTFGTEGLPIPEPGTAVLMGLGLLGLVGFSRRVDSRRR